MAGPDPRLSAWLDLVGDLVRHQTASFPRHALLAQMYSTFGAQASYEWLDPSGACGTEPYIPVPGWPPPEQFARMVEARPNHPILLWFAVTGSRTPMSTGRVPRRIAEPGRRMVEEFLVPAGFDQQLSIPYRQGPGHYRALLLSRGGRDYSDADLALTCQIQPLLLMLDRQVSAVERLARPPCDSSLTGRELAVLSLLADGLTAAAIGRRLCISERTVHRHLQGVYRKLHVSDRVRAVIAATEAGLVNVGGSQTNRQS